MELTRFLAQSQDLRDALHAVAQCVTQCLGAHDGVVILAQSTDAIGHLAATSAVVTARGRDASLSVSLNRHREIRDVLASGRTGSQSISTLPEALAPAESGSAPFRGTAVISPIRYEGTVHGVVYACWRQPHPSSDQEVATLELIANAAAMALRNAQMAESLLHEKRQITQQRARAEHRMRFFQRYADFFESAADGMLVVDHGGRILFSNPKASEITRYSRAELNNAPVRNLLRRSEVARTANLIRGFSRGIYPRSVEVRFSPKRTRDADSASHDEPPKELILNVTFSPVLRAEGAILFTFRDVTAERETAAELRRTTEFLERVIDSSVDAIVSSDMTGRVLIFNRSAARIFGYEQNDVIGKLRVDRLYPEGVARDVMRRIRSDDYGGARRLEDYRVDMMGSRGEVIPVNISAALIMDGGKPIGSVGVFTDVRDKLRMESRLQAAQAELREHEKGLALAELAGATAHELNQPLTSVIGYADILMRQLARESREAQAASVILSESQRMAGIVKKIGRITRYETRNYVGDTQIIDLDKSTL